MKQRGCEAMVCMITAYANIDTAIAATRQGVDFFLPKPFSPDDLEGVPVPLPLRRELDGLDGMRADVQSDDSFVLVKTQHVCAYLY
jgi:DNA-binding response OmpR family regulator